MPDQTPAPSQANLLQSLSDAAAAAQDAYQAALSANPDGDLGQLYQSSLDAQTIYMTALNKTFNNDGSASAEQTKLDAAINSIKDQLATLTDVIAWTTLASNVVQLATTLSSFFV